MVLAPSFLEAKLLYKPLYTSVGRSVGRYVDRSVGWGAISVSDRISRLSPYLRSTSKVVSD